MDNIDKVKVITKISNGIETEEKFIKTVSSMINGTVSTYLRVTFEDGNYTACASVTMDVKEELTAILEIHKNRLDKYKSDLDNILNGEYNRLVEHNKECRNMSDKENPYV